MKTQWTLPGFSLDTSWLRQDGRGLLKSACTRFKCKTVSGKVGFYDLPNKTTPADLDTLQDICRTIQSEFQAALLIGIGGSYLGAASAVQAMGTEEFPLTWVSNVDPAAISATRKRLSKHKHATVVMSKSGNTTETLAAFYHFSGALDAKGITVITDPCSGELRRLAKSYGWRCLEIAPEIGGRFSVLSPIGLLPCALSGINIRELICGAAAMRDQLESFAPEQNPASLLATAKYLCDVKQGCGLHYLMPYWSSLSLFAQWYVQLWGESLGKLDASGKRVGPTPVAALGTTDQHSVLQLFKEGPRNKLVGFVDILSQGSETAVGFPPFSTGDSGYLCRHTFEKISHEACNATRKSLEASEVPTYLISIPALDARTLGALYFFFETTTAIAAELYAVNAFDQPGVEESKQLLRVALN